MRFGARLLQINHPKRIQARTEVCCQVRLIVCDDGLDSRPALIHVGISIMAHTPQGVFSLNVSRAALPKSA